MNKYLETTIPLEMKEDFNKLEDFERGVLIGMDIILNMLGNLYDELDFDTDEDSEILVMINREIKINYLKDTIIPSVKNKILEHLTSFVDSYYLEYEEECK